MFLLALLVYSTIISLEFIVITTLYATSSAGCQTNQIPNLSMENAPWDILNYDASDNSNKEPITKEGDKDRSTIACDCGACSVVTIFAL